MRLRYWSGMKIIGAILKGERDPWSLAALVEPEVKATLEDIAKSLLTTGAGALVDLSPDKVCN